MFPIARFRSYEQKCPSKKSDIRDCSDKLRGLICVKKVFVSPA